MQKLTNIRLIFVFFAIAIRYPVQSFKPNDGPATHFETESKLKKALLDNYDKHVIPIKDAKTPVEIKIGLSLINVGILSPENDKFSGSFFYKLGWNDPRLAWDPAEYGNITQVMSLEYDKLWIPDVTLYFGEAEVTDMILERIYTVANYKGDVLWVPPVKISTQCFTHLNDSRIFKGENRPEFEEDGIISNSLEDFDRGFHVNQRHQSRGSSELSLWCTFLFGSWVLDTSRVKLSFMDLDKKVDLESYTPASHWELVKNFAFIRSKTYPCCPDNPYESIAFNLKFRRIFPHH